MIMLSMDRRRFVAGAAAAGVLLPQAARAESGLLAFDVSRNGSKIGTHTIRLRQDGDRVETDIAIDLEVRLAFITAYRYTHRNHEVYVADRLVSMQSWTDDNGTRYEVDARNQGDRLVVTGTDGTKELPAGILPTTYWKPRMVQDGAWINTQHGRLVEGRSELVGEELVEVGSQVVPSEHWAIRGDVNLDLWYGDIGWTQLAFTIRGDNHIRYTRRPESDVASLPQAVRA
ncbi:MAG: hypothetical protein EA356_11430 [Geminicoccaceae bacterium]|nr:MAG: hypothetical protein EA356_11430 [Geminicoccaceae bacterium]